MPGPLPLDPAYPRHEPAPREQAAAMRGLAATHDWADRLWPELVVALFALGRTDIRLARLLPGGIGVAAVWTGAAARLGDLLGTAVPAARRSPAQVARRGLIRADLALAAAVCRSPRRGRPRRGRGRRTGRRDRMP